VTSGRLLRLAGLSLAAYGVGSVQASRVVQRLAGDVAFTEATDVGWGDGNVIRTRTTGASIVAASAGPRLGLVATLMDTSKSVVPYLLLRRAFPQRQLHTLWASASILGHVFPPQQGLAGGRGISMLMGTCLVVDPLSIPLTIAVSQLLGIYVLRNPKLGAMGFIALLPPYFALRRRPDMAAYTLLANAARWTASVETLRQVWEVQRAGQNETREFHEAFEQSYPGYIHKWLRERGLVHYDYMDEEPVAVERPPSSGRRAIEAA
jgi:glycerol-3-phosphate acyltransferase PlsY